MEIKDLVLQKPRFNALIKKLRSFGNAATPCVNTIQLKGLTGSSAATFLSPVKNAVDRIFLCILNDEEQAGYFYHDLCQVGGEDAVFFFPSGYKRSIKYGQIDSANAILRTEVLSSINRWIEKQQEQQPQPSETDTPAACGMILPRHDHRHPP